MTAADAGPLIAYAQIERIDILRSLFGTLDVSAVVAAEVAPTLPVLPPWVAVHPPGLGARLPASSGALDDGERTALELALVLRPELVLADDLRARRAASRHGFRVLGSVGVAIRAKEVGPLDALVGVRLFIDLTLYRAALEVAGEPAAEPLPRFPV